MALFEYVAKNNVDGSKVKSTVQADSDRAAAKLLIAQGLTPLNVRSIDEGSGWIERYSNRIRSKDKVIFFRQFATLLNAGLPLVQSLRIVKDQSESKRLQAIAQEVIGDVEGGKTLSSAFEKHPNLSSNVIVALVAAGEVSGTLDTSLERIANQLEKDSEVMGKVRSAMVYPIIVVVVIIAVIAFMMIAVMPQIQQLYVDLKQQLPFITLVMVGFSTFIRYFWWLILILMGLAVYFSKQYIATKSGREHWDSIKYNMPLFGKLFKKLYMARFTRTGEVLLSSGVHMIEMLKICADAVNNVKVGQSIKNASEKVHSGKALSVALKDESYILPLVPQMIGIGEQSGSIDSMMEKSASYYEKELDNEIRALSTAIEPVLMVLLAIVAGFLVVAILLPIYGLVGSGAIN
ncbi:type II secretion system F family protein [Candidatus Saccharibacteria bacterium]|nr:type II secretion system F family protein [Candidatus Saccharibacteria bacterium]NCU40522.1 type II secretion system F family protein [Candidatus Saccharibacteria bacterium]